MHPRLTVVMGAKAASAGFRWQPERALKLCIGSSKYFSIRPDRCPAQGQEVCFRVNEHTFIYFFWKSDDFQVEEKALICKVNTLNVYNNVIINYLLNMFSLWCAFHQVGLP